MEPLRNAAEKPETAIVTLLDSEGSREYDRVTLQFARSFKMTTPSTYAWYSEVLLKGE